MNALKKYKKLSHHHYNKNETNYEILYNIEKLINYNNGIIKDINSINNESKLENKFNKILTMHNKNNINENNQINLVVKIEKEDIGKEIYFFPHQKAYGRYGPDPVISAG